MSPTIKLIYTELIKNNATLSVRNGCKFVIVPHENYYNLELGGCGPFYDLVNKFYIKYGIFDG